MAAIGRLAWIQIDCINPRTLAAFWSQVFGVEVGRSVEDPVEYLSLAPTSLDAPLVTFRGCRNADPRTRSDPYNDSEERTSAAARLPLSTAPFR